MCSHWSSRSTPIPQSKLAQPQAWEVSTHSLLPISMSDCRFRTLSPIGKANTAPQRWHRIPSNIIVLLLSIGCQVSNALGWSNHARGARCAWIGRPNTRSHIIIAATSGPACHQRWPYSRCATSPGSRSLMSAYRLRRPWGVTSKGKLRHWRRWRALTTRTVAIPALSNRALHDRA